MAGMKDTPQFEVANFHKKADTDGGRNALHHTLGAQKEQASPGNHDHHGGDSVLMLKDIVLSGSRGGNVALVSIIAALVDLGATDSTVA